jgi:hypothetical protein
MEEDKKQMLIKKAENIIFENKIKTFLKNGIDVETEATSKLLPNTVNHIILLGVSLIVILSTLSDSDNHNICIYHYLLCTLLLSVFLGVICISIITIDYYILGKKLQKMAKERNPSDLDKNIVRTGKPYFWMILLTFLGSLISFLTSLVLLVTYAW